MINKTPFDAAARQYDADFTSSLIGSSQRELVHDYLEKNFLHNKFNHVLELNCGTGEDALFLAKKGCNVLATDISDEMLKIAEVKINSAGLKSKICIKKLDINDVPSENFEMKFDLIFSNFGGLNCISRDKIKGLSPAFHKILNPRGRMIFTIMPSLTLWEIFYFIVKGNFKEAFRRRKRSGIEAKIKNSSVRAYYYSPGEIRKIFYENFKMVGLKPVGFFVPPSYLEYFISRKSGLFQSLKKIERSIKNVSVLSSFSDHFIIDLEAKQ